MFFISMNPDRSYEGANENTFQAPLYNVKYIHKPIAFTS